VGNEEKKDSISFASIIGCGSPDYPVDLPYVDPLSILTSKSITRNYVDGSFTINLSYICNDQETCSIGLYTTD
jgi:hypothetical protein